jgi:hypothetical protein
VELLAPLSPPQAASRQSSMAQQREVKMLIVMKILA